MASQGAIEIVTLEPGAIDPSRVRATLRLDCGCVVTREIARDRILDDVEPPRAVGKYPCPLGHPVRSSG